MTKIFLIRHAEAEGNLYGMMQGQIDLELTAKGRKQAETLIKRFEGVRLNAVYSSPMRRAVETARGFAAAKGIDIRLNTQLRERGLGEWDGHFLADLAYKFPKKMEIYRNRPNSWRVEGSETFREAGLRLAAAIESLCACHEGETIAVVSHGGALRGFTALTEGIDFECLTSVETAGNASVSLLICDGDTRRFEYVNDMSHLAVLPAELRNPAAVPELRAESFSGEQARAQISKMDDAERAILSTVEWDVLIRLFLEKHPVGFLAMDVASDRYGRISAVYLYPEYQDRGFGTQLTGRAISISYRMGKAGVCAPAVRNGEMCTELLLKLGFKLSRKGEELLAIRDFTSSVY